MEKQRSEESEKRRAEEIRSEKKEHAGARKGSNVAKHCVFQMICGSGGSNSRLAKAAGAEPCGQMRGEQLHAVAARSESQNVQNTPFSEHFWKLRCRKSARPCAAKHISKSKCTKHTRIGAFLEVVMSKKCMLLWREAHFQVKMYKTHQVRNTFCRWDVEKVHAVAARSTFPGQTCYVKTDGLGPLLDVQMSFRVAGARDCAPCQKWAKREALAAVSTTTTTTLHPTTLHYNYNYNCNYNYNYNYITLYTLHYYTTLITLHSTMPHYNYNYRYIYNCNYTTLITQHYTLHYAALTTSTATTPTTLVHTTLH